MADELVSRLEAAARRVAEPAKSAIRDAIAEIAALRRALNGRDEALMSAIRLMQDYAYKSGWYEAGYIAIDKRYADPAKVAKSCLARFKEETK